MAFDFPNPIAPFEPPCICFIKKIQTPIKSNIGNQEIKTDKIPGIPLSNGTDDTFIPFSDNLVANSSSLGTYEKKGVPLLDAPDILSP